MEEQILKIITENGQSEDDNDALVIKYPPDLAKEITSHVMEFAKWGVENTVRLYWRDELYQILETNISVKSIDELYQYWLTEVKHN
jgi:hypothetical protein